MLTMQDAAYATNLKSGFDATAGYLGGSALNEWTPEEFFKVQERRLLIWVGAVGSLSRPDPAGDAYMAVTRARSLTCHIGRTIALDMETSTDAHYVSVFGAVAHMAHFFVWVYGSLGNIISLPALDGRWVADPGNAAHLSGVPDEVACQWTDTGKIDESLIASGEALRMLW